MNIFVRTIGIAALALGSAAGTASKASPEDSSAEETFRTLTQEWENAVQARDIGRVSQIEHDDYRNVGPGTLVSTKERDLAVLASGTVKHVVAEFGPMDVKMLGDDVAVVQGSLTDRSSAGAAAGSATLYVFMDVWVKHGDKWSIIRSQSAKVK
jgi:ketosteroid isomerase-like protein